MIFIASFSYTIQRNFEEPVSSERVEATGRGSMTGSPDRASRSPRVRNETEAPLVKLKKILLISNAAVRRREMIAFSNRLAPEQFAEASEWLKRQDYSEKKVGEMAVLFAVWARRDPHEAMKHATYGNSSEVVLRTWAEVDSKAALDWARSTAEGRRLPQVIAAIASWDVPAAMKLVDEVDDPERRSKMLLEVVGFMDGQPAIAERLLPLLDDPADQIMVLETALQRGYSAHAPRLAKLLVQVPAIHERWDKYHVVFEDWVQIDPPAAAAFLDALPPGDLKNRGLADAAAGQSSRDPAGALRTLEKYPEAMTEESLTLLAGRLYWREPKIALAALAHLSDPGAHDRAMVKTIWAQKGNSWLKSPEESRRWLNENGVPERFHERIINFKPDPR